MTSFTGLLGCGVKEHFCIFFFVFDFVGSLSLIGCRTIRAEDAGVDRALAFS